jgi:hypothetical protein
MKVLKAIISSFAFFMFVFWAGESKAIKVFWCQGQKISLGNSTYFVQKYCGQPAYKEDITVANEGCARIEKWYYDCIGRGYIDEFTFKSGILVNQSRGEESRGVQECK